MEHLNSDIVNDIDISSNVQKRLLLLEAHCQRQYTIINEFKKQPNSINEIEVIFFSIYIQGY